MSKALVGEKPKLEQQVEVVWLRSIEKESWKTFDRSLMAILGVAVAGVAILHLSGSGAPFGYGLLALFAAFGIWRCFMHRRWEGLEVAFSLFGIVAFSEGVKVWEIGYGEIDLVLLQEKQLRIEYAGEQRHLVRGRFSEFSNYARAVGMIRRGNPDARVDLEFPRPLNAQDGFEYDHRYLLNPVEMKDGVVYRYRYGDEQANTWSLEMRFIPLWFLISLQQLARLTPEPFDLLWLLVLFVSFDVPSQWIAWHLKRSREDRFIKTPDGIQVVRATRRWNVSNPTPCRLRGWRPNLGGRIVRFKSGWISYYFDPRLIEEDS